LASIEGHRLAVRVLASIQSIFAFALVFVFGLAVRHKFQIGA